ncbi:YeiH family putative sulfate export transporter [Pusillimonas caeni]|uniref:YeiH family protein n=1 Tax=Pusillimonas caeni TaxID=1348472 RepID=UPI000E599B94|nr:YeiH family protein [Pusillimonas caeni]TFL08469.1 YeiH family putative sulfate export transporter [Pusillimonas caeni]
MTQTATLSSSRFSILTRPGFLPGLALTAALAAVGTLLAQTSWLQQAGLSPLTLAIVLGMVAGNTFFPAIAGRTAAGVDFSKNLLLRAGIILFGFRITFQDIAHIGWAGVLIAALMVACTFVLAVQLGTRVLRMDKQTAMLIGAGSAICGAAAVMAAEPVVKGQAHKVTVAVATVVVFGTLAMFAYPLLYPLIGMSEQAFGVYAGSTIHEVAQVVAAGSAVSEAAASTAVIEKMMRVMMLAPFLVLLSGVLSRGEGGGARRVVIPWFAVLFIAAAGINSLQLLPAAVVQAILHVDAVLLAMAMAALGLRTRAGALREAGLRPMLLAATLFAFLLVGGYGINVAVMSLLG